MGPALESFGLALESLMKSQPNDTPQSLRERADRAFRLAASTADAAAHHALLLYGQGLLAEADRIESVAEESRPPAG
jgi:hypothetical protein